MVVDLWFPLRGASLPADHGFALYGALSGSLPALHDAPWWGLHTVRGRKVGDRRMLLPRGSRLGFRLPFEQVPVVLGLAGHTLDVVGHSVILGAPTIEPLAPAPALSSRLVTIKGFTEPAPFAEAVGRQLAERDVQATVTVGQRKVVRVDGKAIVGFSVRLEDLDDGASMRVQEHGLGGRRHFGCGLFRHSRHAIAADERPAEAPE